MLAGEQETGAGGAAAGANGTLAYVGTFSGEIDLVNTPLMNPGQGDTDVFIVLHGPAPDRVNTAARAEGTNVEDPLRSGAVS
jgi:hypothetical protein